MIKQVGLNLKLKTDKWKKSREVYDQISECKFATLQQIHRKKNFFTRVTNYNKSFIKTLENAKYNCHRQ